MHISGAIRLAALAGAAVITLTATGCSTGTAPSAGPVALKLFHIDRASHLDPAVERFVEAVAEASDGDLAIDVVGDCCGKDADLEQKLVESVAYGTADLGWVGTRVFADLGVGDLRALTAPLLLDSYALQEAVITSDFARERLNSVSELGVTGLALLPGPIRVPLSMTVPLVDIDDWSGLVFHTFASELNEQAIAALGATPVTMAYPERDEQIYDGRIQAVENSFDFQASDRESLLPYAAVNVALWPRVSALIGNPQVVASLSESERAALEEAAKMVASETEALSALDAEAIADACTAGSRMGEASEAQLAEFAAALVPVYDELSADPVTDEFITRVRELDQTVTPEPAPAIPSGCTGTAEVAEPGADAGGDDLSQLNGVWTRGPMMVSELIAEGVDSADAPNVTGVFKFEFEDGDFTLSVDDEWVCDGEYEVDNARVTVEYLPGGFCGPGGLLFAGDFVISGDALTLTEVESQNPTDEIFYGLGPFTRTD